MSKFTKVIFSLLVVILISIWAAIAKAPDRKFSISFLNVGQGDSIFIQTAENQKILVDGGPDNSLLSQLPLSFYDRKIDAVFLTHPHADHLFGLIEVLKRYQVGQVYLSGATHTTNEYLEFLQIIKTQQIPTKALKQGDEIDFGKTKFKILWTKESQFSQSIDNLNNTSLVLSVENGDYAALLLGDLELEGQQELLGYVGLLSHYNLIKIAHHGSSNGLDEALLDKIKPETAVISVGAENKYGHPAVSTIEKLQSRNIKILRTDRDGTIKISP